MVYIVMVLQHSCSTITPVSEYDNVLPACFIFCQLVIIVWCLAIRPNINIKHSAEALFTLLERFQKKPERIMPPPPPHELIKVLS